MKYDDIEINPYPRVLYIRYCATDNKEIESSFIDRDCKEFSISEGIKDADAAVFEVINKSDLQYGLLLVINSKLTYKEIAHEAVHIGISVCNDCNISTDVFQDETLAYLVGWLFGVIFKFCNDNKLINKKNI